jgi:cytoskeleton protein RodZ
MDEFGQRLRAAREARGVDLRDIAATTKISVTALEALERNDFSRLPGGIFSRAFIRAYAVQVGLDPEATVRGFLAEIDRQRREAARNAPRPTVSREDLEFLERQQRAERILRVAIIALVGVGLAIGIWRMRASRHAPALAEGAAMGDSVAAPVDHAPSGPTTAEPPGGAGAGAAAGRPAGPAPEAPVTAAPGGATPSAAAPVVPVSGRLTVEFSVNAACWVQASADGRVVLQRLLQAGERERVTADEELVLDVGNAGAFTWSINGHPARPLGAEGVHKRARVTPANVSEFLQVSTTPGS